MILTAGFITHHFPKITPMEPAESTAALRSLFPEAASFSQGKTAAPYFSAFNKDGQLSGFAFFTAQVSPEISGYSGTIELAVGTDVDGIIQNVLLLKSHETPQFTQRLPGLLKQFNGKKSSDPLELGRDIDGVSGATITSAAVSRSIKASLLKMRPIFRQASFSGPALQGVISRQAVIRTIPIMLIFLLAAFSLRKKRGRLMWLTLLVSFLYLGIFRHSMLATLQVAQIGSGLIPRFQDNPELYLLLAGLVISSLLWGRLYCARVCPFAFVEEALYSTRKKLWNAKFPLTVRTARFSRWIKYVLFFTLIILSIAVGSASVTGVEVYLTLFTGQAGAFGWGLLTCVLLGSCLFYRFWCRYLCPFGAFAGLAASLRFKPETANRSRESQSCFERICLTNDTHTPEGTSCLVDQAECLHCGHCVKVGPPSPAEGKAPKLFLLFLSVSLILFTLTAAENIHVFKKQPAAPPSVTAESSALFSTTHLESVRQKLKDSGITPHPAQFWKATDE